VKPTADKGIFDRFAGEVADVASRAPFFAFCVLLILIWAPSFVVLPFDTWQLIINTVTTIITFLLVALLQNSSTRSNTALQRKLDAQSTALGHLMRTVADELAVDMANPIHELEKSIGLEGEVGTKRARS
jgi:low affinity Fe/Cu permease